MSNRYWLKYVTVTSDDFGDAQFKYYVELYQGKKLIWNDYYKTEPTLKQVKKELEIL